MNDINLRLLPTRGRRTTEVNVLTISEEEAREQELRETTDFKSSLCDELVLVIEASLTNVRVGFSVGL